jgi:antitoxin (DNA-binding transcriptional repressor) of toxin-antitoxin stability system
MKRLSVREVRAEVTNLDELLGKEGEVLITRRGKAIARLLPVRSAKAIPSHAALRVGDDIRCLNVNPNPCRRVKRSPVFKRCY